MKKVYTCLLCAIGVQLIAVNLSEAQSTSMTLKPPAGAVVIDGNAKDWGDTLKYYNADKKIRYTLSNDKDKLYLVVKTKDPAQQDNIMAAGITFGIDTKGRKRSSYAITFPAYGEAGPPLEIKKISDQSADQKSVFAQMSLLKKMEVDGFKDISDTYIGTSNTYGIQVGIAFDEQGYLIYEEAIPLALFHAGDLMKNEWAFNIKLNGMMQTVPAAPASNSIGSDAASSGRGGKGGGMVGSRTANTTGVSSTPTTKRITSTIDFWGKFNLAGVQ